METPMDPETPEIFDAFATLDLPRKLDLSELEIESAWQRLSRESHPDSEGGHEDRSAAVNRARGFLATAGNRLRHWLDLHHVSIPRQGAIDDELMTYFAAVGALLSRTDELLKRRASATTHLARALLAEPEIAAQRELQDMLSRLRDETAAIRENFARFDEAAAQGGPHDEAIAAATRLGFLEKWETQCRDRLIRLLAPD